MKISEHNYTAVIMAGGKGTRFRSGFKLTAPVNGIPIVRITAEKALQVFPHVILVTGYHAGAVLDAVRGLPLDIRHNGAWAEGLSASVKCGIRAAAGDTTGICPIPGDQAPVSADTLKRLTEAAAAHPDRIIVPFYHGQRGTPTIFPACLLPELYSVLHGDSGGRSLLQKQGYFTLETEDPGVILDIDTTEEYEKYCSGKDNDEE